MVDSAHIAQREPVARTVDSDTVGILQGEIQTTELRAGSTVGTTAKAILRGIALPGVTHTKGSVDEHLQFDLGHRIVDGTDVLQGKLAGQHHTTESQAAEPSYFFYRAIIGLCRSVERESTVRGYMVDGRRLVETSRIHPHILHEDGIDAYRLELVDEAKRVVEFIVVDDGVHRDVDLRIKLMRIAAQLGDVVNRVAGCHTSAEAVGTDINSISTVVDGSHATSQVLGWCQQFDGSYFHQLSIINFQLSIINFQLSISLR